MGAGPSSLRPSAAPSAAAPCVPLEVGLRFDVYPAETGWFLVRGAYDPDDPDPDVVWRLQHYRPLDRANRADAFRACVPGGAYAFVFTDREADGVCCRHGEGAYVLSSAGTVIAVGGEMRAREEVAAFALPYVAPPPVDADGDGRDDRLGLLLPPTASNLTEGADCEHVRFVLVTDDYGVEATWELVREADGGAVPVADGGPYGPNCRSASWLMRAV